MAAAAHAGDLSAEQLGSVVRLADEESDAEWAQRAPHVAPVDLARLARSQSKPSIEDWQQRRAARSLRMWWEKDRGMLQVRGELPDLMGAKFEAAINRMTERMRPAKGQAWVRFEQRAADALGELVDVWETTEPPTAAAKPLLVVQVPKDGPAEVAGIPLPDAVVESTAREREHRTRPRRRRRACPVTVGKRTTALSTQDRPSRAPARWALPDP